VSRTLVGKEFHGHGPATEKALSLRRRLVQGIQKSPLNINLNIYKYKYNEHDI